MKSWEDRDDEDSASSGDWWDESSHDQSSSGDEK